MIAKQIKEIAEKNNKKIGKDSINKIKLLVNKNIETIIQNASHKADLFGRKIIKREDIE